MPPPLTSGEARSLGSWIKSINGESLSWLKGYLFCIATTPGTVPAHMWQSELLQQELNQAQCLGEDHLLVRLFHHTQAEAAAGNPKLPSNCNLQTPLEHNFRPGSGLNDWSRGFDQAMERFCYPLWQLASALLNKRDANDLESLWSMLTFFASQPERAELSMPLEEAATLVRKQLPWAIKDYAGLHNELDAMLGEVPDDIKLPDELMAELRRKIESGELIDDDHPFADLQPNDIRPGDEDPVDELIQQAFDTEDLAARQTLIEQAQSLAEQQLGAETFEQHAGNFWLLTETRSFMRILALLRKTCRQRGLHDQAIGHCQRALQLCPNDNLGLRYPLLGLLLETERHDQVKALLDRYDEDSAPFLYGRALLAYRAQRDSLAAAAARRQAVQENPHVPALLQANQTMPEEGIEFYSPGDRNEALMICEFLGTAWHNTPGAVQWINAVK